MFYIWSLIRVWRWLVSEYRHALGDLDNKLQLTCELVNIRKRRCSGNPLCPTLLDCRAHLQTHKFTKYFHWHCVNEPWLNCHAVQPHISAGTRTIIMVTRGQPLNICHRFATFNDVLSFCLSWSKAKTRSRIWGRHDKQRNIIQACRINQSISSALVDESVKQYFGTWKSSRD